MITYKKLTETVIEMTLKNDIEIIWLPLPEIFPARFTYLLTVVVSSFQAFQTSCGEDGYNDNSAYWQ